MISWHMRSSCCHLSLPLASKKSGIMSPIHQNLFLLLLFGLSHWLYCRVLEGKRRCIWVSFPLPFFYKDIDLAALSYLPGCLLFYCSQCFAPYLTASGHCAAWLLFLMVIPWALTFILNLPVLVNWCGRIVYILSIMF